MTGRLAFTLAIVFGLHLSALAQYTSKLGRFDVSQVKGCMPLTVNVSINDPFKCDASNSCDMDYEGDGTFQQLTFTHTYDKPGKYNLKILFQTTGWDSIAIEVMPSIPPAFDVYSCGNNEVAVTIDDTNYDEYVIDYDDGNPPLTGPAGVYRHTYANSDTRTIRVRGRDMNAADNCAQGGMIVTPRVTLPAPTITLLEVLDDSRIRLEFDAEPNILYKLGIATNNGSSFQQLKTIYNTTTDTITNLKTDGNYYCFQLAAFDPCNNTVIPSATICSSRLSLSVQNRSIDIAWSTAAGGISGYELTRTASDGTTLVTNPTGSPYTDTGILCGTEYCYRLTMLYPNGSRSVSASRCGTGFSTDIPTAIENITAVVNDNSVLLQWQTDPDFTPTSFTIEKSVQGSYSILGTTTQPAFADPEYNTNDNSCYRIGYTDACDNESPLSAEACPIRLSATLMKDNSVSLSWTPYQGWKEGVSGYVLEKYSGDGVLLQTFNVGNETSYTDTSDDLTYQTFIFVVKATPLETGIGQAASNKVSVLKNPNLSYPAAFTPNGDNLNDVFTVFGQYVESFEMKIFNRWGELLFTTADMGTGWDGTFRGSEVPEGTYTFIAHITDHAGRTFKRSGAVLLLRKK